MKKPVFTGSNVALITPFTSDDRINFQKLDELIDFHIENGTDSITVCGTTGEKSTLDDREHKENLIHCIDRVAGRIPVIAGTGSNDTRYCLQMSNFAESAGADGLLLVTPYYNKTTQEGLIKHFYKIADSINIPAILYNVPSRTGMTITADTYYELSKHPNINGTKEASSDIDLISAVRKLCGDDLNIWSGEDSLIVPILSLGGKGIISVAANIIPATVSEICSLWFRGKVCESAKLAIDYYDIMHGLFLETNPIPVKAAMNLMGMDVGETRMPLTAMGSANLDKLKKCLADHSLI